MPMSRLSPSLGGLLPAEQSTVLGQLGEGIMLADLEGRIVFVNAAAARFHGVSQLDVTPADYSRVYGLLTEDGRPYPPYEWPLARAVLNGETVIDARWCVRRDGASGMAQPLFDADGMITGAVLTFRDDTTRVQAERRLADMEERYRLAADATRDAIWDWDTRTNQTRWNARLLDVYGHRPDAPNYTWFLSQIHPDDRERVHASLQEAVHGSGMHWTEEYRFRRADGSYAKVHDRGAVARDANGCAMRMIGSMVDITEGDRF